MTSVVNVKVKYIRPKYNNLEEWMRDKKNIYIARRGVVFIDKERYPKTDSVWSNPFKLNKDGSNREHVLNEYEKYIRDKLKDKNMVKELLKLKNKTLGCWCREPNISISEIYCHGDILVKLIKEYDTKDELDMFCKTKDFKYFDLLDIKTQNKFKKYAKKALDIPNNKRHNLCKKIIDYFNTPKIIEIYTDGSHQKHTDNYIGFGAYCKYIDKEFKLSGTVDEDILKFYDIKDDIKISNPTAEFLGFAEVLRILYTNLVDKKLLYKYKIIFKIDYIGIREWMNDKWKCKEIYISNIKNKCLKFIESLKNIEIIVEHISGHTGIYGNEQADILAKSSIIYNNYDELTKLIN